MNKPSLPAKLTPVIKDGQRITIIGLGGVGEKVARNAALFLAASNTPVTLTLVDGDSFSPSNASRALFKDFGNKAEVVASELLPGFVANDTKLKVETIPEFVMPSNLSNVIREGDIVMLCLDNHSSRKLISDWCSTMKNVTLMSAGCDGVGPDRGTYCNVQVYIRRDGQDLTSSLTALHPEIAQPADKMPHEMSCTEKMISTPQIIFANLAAASILLNAFYLHLCGCLHYEELCVDIADGRMQTVIDL